MGSPNKAEFMVPIIPKMPLKAVKVKATDIEMLLLLGVTTTLVIYYLSFLWRKRHMLYYGSKMPGPLNLPLVGAGYLFMVRPEYIYGRITSLQYYYPKLFQMWFGNRMIVSLHEPHHIEKVLNNPNYTHKEVLYKYLTECIGSGLITAPVSIWRKHRKLIMPSFNQKILDSFVEVFAEQSKIFTEIISKMPNQEFDLYELMSRCTLDILCETAMGLQLGIQTSENSRYGAIFDKILLLSFLRIFQIWNHNSFIWNNITYGKKLNKYVKIFNDLADKVIKEKMDLKKQRKYSEAKIEDLPPVKRLAFLDLIMESNELSEQELRDEVNIFLFAGTDTTASTMSFLVAVLGMFPDVQQKVYEEVIEIMGPDRYPVFDDLPKMKYTERVIKETLRLFPVGAFFLRAVNEDIDIGDYIVPKGASAFFGTVFIHRNPKYWPDPLKFDPDRFLPEEIAKRPPCAYIPFSFGPRNCIGMRYAMMNMKVIISTVVRKLKINCGYKRIEDVKLKANIVLRFRNGAKVTVEPRE